MGSWYSFTGSFCCTSRVIKYLVIITMVINLLEQCSYECNTDGKSLQDETANNMFVSMHECMYISMHMCKYACM